VRTAVTDGTGQYRIVDLRPGTYAVTFADWFPAGSSAKDRADRIVHDGERRLEVNRAETVTVSGTVGC
jgi:hypothetical protein